MLPVNVRDVDKTALKQSQSPCLARQRGIPVLSLEVGSSVPRGEDAPGPLSQVGNTTTYHQCVVVLLLWTRGQANLRVPCVIGDQRRIESDVLLVSQLLDTLPGRFATNPRSAASAQLSH